MVVHLAEYVIIVARPIRVQVFIAFQDATSLFVLVKRCLYLDFFVFAWVIVCVHRVHTATIVGLRR